MAALIPEHFSCCKHGPLWGAFDWFARAVFLKEKPAMMACQWLEGHGLPSPKAHLCAYGYTILKNALAEKACFRQPLAVLSTTAGSICSLLGL
jgi:hypothetical protein